MSYEKQTWNKYDDLKTEEENIENGAVVTDNRMNHIEEGIEAHTTDFKNPHKVTAAQVGLGNVQNFGLATEDEAKQGISNAKYMTPSLTQAVLSANINSIAYAYSSDGTDRFTTVYPNLNLLVNSSAKTKDGFFKDFDKVENGYGEVAIWGKNGYVSRNLWDGFSIKPRDYKPGDTYTMSMDIMFTSWNMPAGASIGEFWMGQRYTWGGGNVGAWNRISYIDLPKDNSKILNQWIRITQTSTVPSYAEPAVNTETIFLTQFNGTTMGSFIIRVRNPKQEPGSTATPHMPSASEVTTADWPKYVGFSNTVKTNKSASDYAWFPVKDSELTNKVDSHVNNKANPHSVTASQVGAYTKDESDQKLAAQKQAIDSHVNNKSNPHTVTASQVGAYSKQEIDTKLSKAVMADDSGKVTVKTLQVETIKSNSDTDLLNLSLTGVASATFSYIRINGIVYITAAGNWGNFPDNKQRIVGNIPAGFRPPTDWGTGMNPQGGSRLLSAVIKANGDLGVTSDAAQNNVYGQFSMSYPGI
ncbi:hypothetical protein [Lactococcus lactis]|uniref:hypothetical protein n=1 Tax=Lactococcus lactis TaxID=1358 RepID=UPI001F079C3D|nr:hypothetical protein [Lactococcus lactis]